MATPSYTTDTLITSVKNRGMLPTSSALGNAAFLSFMNDEIDTYIVPLLMSVRGGYLLVETPLTLTVGTAEYYIPERAIGAKMHKVEVLVGSEYEELIEGSDYDYVGNRLVFSPTPTTADVLKLSYFQRPSRCVIAADCGVVLSTSTPAVTVVAAPTDWATTSANYDFIKGTGPGFDARAIDRAATRSGTTLTFALALPSGVVAGDYIAQAGETPVPQIPVDFQPLLAQRIVCRALEALGANTKLPAAEATAERMKKALLSTISPRTEGQSRRVVSRFAPGFTTSSGRRWRT